MDQAGIELTTSRLRQLRQLHTHIRTHTYIHIHIHKYTYVHTLYCVVVNVIKTNIVSRVKGTSDTHPLFVLCWINLLHLYSYMEFYARFILANTKWFGYMGQDDLFCFQAYPSIVGEYGRMAFSCGYLGWSLIVWNTEERYIVLNNRLTHRNPDPNNTRFAIADIRILIEYETKSSTLMGSSVHNRIINIHIKIET